MPSKKSKIPKETEKSTPKVRIKRTHKLKFNKIKDLPPARGKAQELSPIDSRNKKLKDVLNKTGLDLEKLHDVGQFLGLSEEELMDIVPLGGQGVHNQLTSEEKSSRMVLVWRLMMRGVGNQEIADQLEISTRMVGKIKLQVKDLQRRDMTNIDLNGMLGHTIAVFVEIQQMALAISSSSTESTRNKLIALNVAQQAEMNKARFLDYCGVFRYVQNTPGMINDVIETKVINDGAESDEVSQAMDAFALELFASPA